MHDLIGNSSEVAASLRAGGLLWAFAMVGCISKAPGDTAETGDGAGMVCDTPWRDDMASDPAFTSEDGEGRSGNYGVLQWFPDGFFLQTVATDALHMSTPTPGPLDVTYDAEETTLLYRLCGADWYHHQCGVTIDCWDASSGTIHLVGEFSEFVDSTGDEACCEGELSVEMQSIVFDGGPTIEHLETHVFVEPYNSL